MTRKKLFILAVCMFCFMIFADYSTRSNRELKSADKGGEVPSSEVESSYSVDNDGVVTELDEQDDQRTTTDEEVYVNEYEEGVSFEVPGTE